MSIPRYYNRVIKEIESIENINNSDITYYLNCQVYIITFSYLYNNKNYSIYVKLDNNYPFKSPCILKINNKSYPYNCCTNADISTTLYKLYKIKCLWCNSLLCPNNWLPTITIKILIDECINNELAIDSINKMNIINKRYNLPIEVEKYILDYCFIL